MKRYRLIYAGMYASNQLYGIYDDYEIALAVKREAVKTALLWGNRQLAASFDIV